VLVRTEIPEDAFTAPILGTERIGNGVVIRGDGLVLTIGYLITEASTVWLTTNSGTAVAGFPVAYDQPTGFGLIQPLGQLGAPAIARGPAVECRVGDRVVVAGHGGRAHALRAKIAAKREFAGYWEYVLDEALFTTPAHPQWGGAALISEDGVLLGIGSLLVQENFDAETTHGNMIVPIDAIEPILDDMLRIGRADRAPRPWLGLYAAEVESHVALAGIVPGGPAERAGLEQGDLLIAVAGDRVRGLAEFFRKVWRLGDAGIDVPLTISRDGKTTELRVHSADRSDFLKKPHLH
jgi:S1-C subfamily serine protease